MTPTATPRPTPSGPTVPVPVPKPSSSTAAGGVLGSAGAEQPPVPELPLYPSPAVAPASTGPLAAVDRMVLSVDSIALMSGSTTVRTLALVPDQIGATLAVLVQLLGSAQYAPVSATAACPMLDQYFWNNGSIVLSKRDWPAGATAPLPDRFQFSVSTPGVPVGGRTISVTLSSGESVGDNVHGTVGSLDLKRVDPLSGNGQGYAIFQLSPHPDRATEGLAVAWASDGQPVSYSSNWRAIAFVTPLIINPSYSLCN